MALVIQSHRKNFRRLDRMQQLHLAELVLLARFGVPAQQIAMNLVDRLSVQDPMSGGRIDLIANVFCHLLIAPTARTRYFYPRRSISSSPARRLRHTAIGPADQRRRNQSGGHRHKHHHAVDALRHDTHAEADLRHHHADFTARQHPDTHPQSVGAAHANRAQPAGHQLRQDAAIKITIASQSVEGSVKAPTSRNAGRSPPGRTAPAVR